MRICKEEILYGKRGGLKVWIEDLKRETGIGKRV